MIWNLKIYFENDMSDLKAEYLMQNLQKKNLHLQIR